MDLSKKIFVCQIIEKNNHPSAGGGMNIGVIRRRPSTVLISICLSVGALIEAADNFFSPVLLSDLE